MHTRRKIQNFINRQTGKKRVEKNLLSTPLFFITTTWNTCLLPIFPFDQYLSVGIVINPSIRHNRILFQTGAKKKKNRRIDLEKSRDSSLESNRKGGNSFVRGSTRDQWGKKKRERERQKLRILSLGRIR